MTLTLDRREGLLAEALRPLMRDYEIQDLPVGDARCKYEDDTEWILERKTASDLDNSIRTGRYGFAVCTLNSKLMSPSLPRPCEKVE